MKIEEIEKKLRASIKRAQKLGFAVGDPCVCEGVCPLQCLSPSKELKLYGHTITRYIDIASKRFGVTLEWCREFMRGFDGSLYTTQIKSARNLGKKFRAEFVK